MPPFRQQFSYTAYAEGWALCSESFRKDIGFYQGPYSDFGRLSDELLRAVRLVLDTGVHYKHWTRAQMVDYFHTHSSEDEPDVQSETDRYEVRVFYDEILNGGALPLMSSTNASPPGSPGRKRQARRKPEAQSELLPNR